MPPTPVESTPLQQELFIQQQPTHGYQASAAALLRARARMNRGCNGGSSSRGQGLDKTSAHALTPPHS